jgi:crossover junction endonuclease MUS81
MNIIITPSEVDLIKQFEIKSVSKEKYSTKPLLVGDVHIIKGDKVISIIERKTRLDLIASIKDGRYHEQKNRLISTGLSRDRIFFIIESTPRLSIRSQSMKPAMWSSITNSMIRDGFRVICVEDLSETVECLISICQSFEKFEGPVSSNSEVSIKSTEIKKATATPETMFLNILLLIPGVGKTIAPSIVEEYTSLQNLLKVYSTADNPSAVLASLKRTESDKNIGPVISKRIYEHLVEI